MKAGLQDIVCHCVDWIELAQDWVQVLVKMEVNLLVP